MKPRKRPSFRLAVAGAVIGTLLLAGVSVFLLVWNGIILLNHPSNSRYPVRGIDVSSYQGEIDWDMLASQNIDFAFIKATEGSSFVDPRLAENYVNAQKTVLSIGFYHFFSYDSPGASQAENFIRNVIPFEGMLPPVVDVEFYGDYGKEPKPRDEVTPQLQDMLTALESFYGLKPILYATESSYELYLAGVCEEYDIWIRNIITTPSLSDGRSWTFWQYTNREKLDGYRGKEAFVDMNVFHSDHEAFRRYPRYQ